jgi:hypothetical protein
MDNAVALVQAFLRLHGYLTVTEFPVVRGARGGGQECLTDLDVLAFRFGEASGPGGAMHHPAESEANALLGITGGVPDMIIGEVKEGRAELNDAATRHEVLTAALERFGCCPRRDVDGIAHELLRHGRAHTQHGHGVRLIAFGTLAPVHQDRRCHVVLLGDIVAHLRADMRRHWDAWRASASKDPGFGMLLTLEKAERGHLPAVRGVPPRADQSTGRTRDSRRGRHHG